MNYHTNSKSAVLSDVVVALETVTPFLKSISRRETKRQRKRWEDNIKEWTGLEWNIIQRKAENREEWRKLVLIYSGAPTVSQTTG